MSQYVPSWDFEEISHNNHVDIIKPDSFAFNGSVTDYEEVETVELKWENGQLVFHDLRQPRAPFKPDLPKRIYSWDRPSGAGTLESIVNQATTRLVPQINNNASIINTNNCHGGGDHAVVDAENLVPWFEDHCVKIGGSANGDAGGKVPVDALVPSRVTNERGSNCPVTNEDTVNNSSGVGWTLSSSLGAPGSTFSGKSTNSKTTYTVDDYGSNSLCSGEPQQRKIGKDDTQRKRANIKSSVSTKASRAAAVHNQSERKRRDKINQRMKALQKLVPNSNKIKKYYRLRLQNGLTAGRSAGRLPAAKANPLNNNDKSSMLDEVIEYLKQLQSRVNAVKRMNSMSSMMLPSLAMQQQQQLQMSMMNPLGMGNHTMDLNSMMAPMHNLAAIPSVIPLPPTSLLPLNPWEASGVDPFAAFAACHQSQPMTMDAYAALYQQSNNPPGFMG